MTTDRSGEPARRRRFTFNPRTETLRLFERGDGRIEVVPVKIETTKEPERDEEGT